MGGEGCGTPRATLRARGARGETDCRFHAKSHGAMIQQAVCELVWMDTGIRLRWEACFEGCLLSGDYKLWSARSVSWHRNCAVPARFGSMLVLDLAEIALLYGRWRLKRGSSPFLEDLSSPTGEKRANEFGRMSLCRRPSRMRSDVEEEEAKSLASCANYEKYHVLGVHFDWLAWLSFPFVLVGDLHKHHSRVPRGCQKSPSFQLTKTQMTTLICFICKNVRQYLQFFIGYFHMRRSLRCGRAKATFCSDTRPSCLSMCLI